MATLATLRGKKSTKNTKFIGEDVTICKLSVGQVRQIQEKAKELENSDDDESSLDILFLVLSSGVAEFQDGLQRRS